MNTQYNVHINHTEELSPPADVIESNTSHPPVGGEGIAIPIILAMTIFTATLLDKMKR